jgi:hypothetical protein
MFSSFSIVSVIEKYISLHIKRGELEKKSKKILPRHQQTDCLSSAGQAMV